jgi:hypothetical protein
MCKYELRGVCADSKCTAQHLRDYTLTDVETLLDLADYASSSDLSSVSNDTSRQKFLQKVQPTLAASVKSGYSDSNAHKVVTALHELEADVGYSNKFMPLRARSHRIRSGTSLSLEPNPKKIPEKPKSQASKPLKPTATQPESYLAEVRAVWLENLLFP